jgi:hypothetical protein
MTIDSRRNFLTTGAAAAGLVLASLPASAGHDPIFAAIDAHVAATKAIDDAQAILLAVAPDPLGPDCARMQAALWAGLAASKSLVETVPTTRAGLQAFASHLRDPRHHFVERHIHRTIELDDDGEYRLVGGRDAIEFLISRRKAELG